MLQIEVNLGAVAELLIDHGHLREWDGTDRTKVQDALQEAIRVWSSYDTV